MSEGIFRVSGQGRSFLFGTVPVVIKLEREDTDDAFALVEAEFPAGLPGPPRHRHPWHESFYVLSGELQFTVGNELIRAGSGDFVHAAPGVPHTYANPGSAPAAALGLFAPARFLAALEEMATAFPSEGGPPDMQRLQEIYAKWGQEIVPLTALYGRSLSLHESGLMSFPRREAQPDGMTDSVPNPGP
jgi:quercetin dioxygenase-like cupin family protein